MSIAQIVDEFVRAVATLQMDDCFNPYADRYCPFDLDDAPMIRASNLRHVLSAAAALGVSDLWIGLELGHNGGRRTGLAMTDDTNLLAHGNRFGVAERLRRATKAGPVKEMTASVVWQALSQIERPVFLWNVVPVHPHRPSEPLTNRRHTTTERKACLSHLHVLVDLLRPKRIVAVGNDAGTALKHCGYRYVPVRHPAYGGKRQFLEQVAALD